jgi:hypothetical protein
MSDTVAITALEWALTHVEKYSDTDLFPRAFEFAAVRNNWPEIRTFLAAQDLATHAPEAPRRLMVPKSRFGFRAGHQLHPLDSLLYASMVYEVAPKVEDARVIPSSRVACSFRLELGPDGKFFKENDGYPDFHERSKELANSEQYKFVVVADIADFYNQIYTHRVQSILETAGVSEGRARNLEAFILKLSAKQSRGLPVGPYASIVLAEACLDDVDRRLLTRGLTHTRYVDDFRIFCGSRREALAVLHDLCDYLYTSHRLTLQNSKTQVLSVREFKSKHLHAPEEQELNSKKSLVEGLLEQWREVGYQVSAEDLDKESLNQVQLDTIKDLFAACVAEKDLRVSLARYLLRRAAALRTRSIYESVFDNLELLSPVMRDVALYLAKTMPAERAEGYGSRLLEFLGGSDVGGLPFVRTWGLYLLRERPNMLPAQYAMRLAEEIQNDLGLRPAALLARAHKLVDWVRPQKENWGNHGPWDRRAIIWAGSVLPSTERKKWLELVRDGGDLLDRSVAMLAASGMK